MRRLSGPRALPLIVATVAGLPSALALCGCGGGATSSSTTSTQLFPTPTHSIRTGPSKAKPRPTMVAVPDVVGTDEQTASDELITHHLRPVFVSHNRGALVCAKQAPGSTTTYQVPEADQARAGARIHLTTNAYVQTTGEGCGRASASRACSPDELSLQITDRSPDFTGGSEDELAGVRITHTGSGSPCNVDSTLRFQVERQGQLVSGLGGNPMSLHLHAALDLGDSIDADWSIGGWCGSNNGVTASASLEGVTAQGPLTNLAGGGSRSCPALDLNSLYKKHG
jgi:hypothetical protein